MIQSYFYAEKRGGYFALGIGIFACFVGGCFFLKAAPPFYIGLAIPLILIGIVQMTVGSVIMRRTDQQAEDLENLLAENPSKFSRQENSRMTAVMRSFKIYFWVEITIIATGLGLIFLNQEVNFWKGLGAGMFAQAVIMLVFDYFAEKRGHEYSAFVQKTDV